MIHFSKREILNNLDLEKEGKDLEKEIKEFEKIKEKIENLNTQISSVLYIFKEKGIFIFRIPKINFYFYLRIPPIDFYEDIKEQYKEIEYLINEFFPIKKKLRMAEIRGKKIKGDLKSEMIYIYKDLNSIQNICSNLKFKLIYYINDIGKLKGNNTCGLVFKNDKYIDILKRTKNKNERKKILLYYNSETKLYFSNLKALNRQSEISRKKVLKLFLKFFEI